MAFYSNLFSELESGTMLDTLNFNRYEYYAIRSSTSAGYMTRYSKDMEEIYTGKLQFRERALIISSRKISHSCG